MNAEELLQLSREEGDYELIRGRLIEVDFPGAEHGAVAGNVGFALDVHVRAHRLGRTYAAETGFLLETDPDTVRAPDASFVLADRVVRTDKYFPGPPDFCVEVVSPTDRAASLERKAFHWLEAGCLAVLVLHPRLRTATVYRSRDDVRRYEGDAEIDLSDAVPGWRVALAPLFD